MSQGGQLPFLIWSWAFGTRSGKQSFADSVFCWFSEWVPAGPTPRSFEGFCVFGKRPRGQTLHFMRFWGLRKGARGQAPCIYHVFLAFGSGPWAQPPIVYMFWSFGSRSGTKLKYFTMFLGMRHGARGPKSCIGCFGPSERGRGPKTLFFVSVRNIKNR